MFKWVVAIVVVAILLTNGSPWAGPAISMPTLSLDGPAFAHDLGLIGLLIGVFCGLALLGLLLTLLVAIIGGAVVLLFSLPLLILLAVVGLVFAPILLPIVLVLMVIGMLIKGIGLAFAF